jgi:murein DD-endopeptidase MepM/ murein hydrolase activator NlpD
MNKFFESVLTFFNSIKNRFGLSRDGAQAPEQPEDVPRVLKMDRFTLISWGVTLLIVATLLGTALWWKNVKASAQATQPQPTAESDQNPPDVGLPNPGSSLNGMTSIQRELRLKTNIPERPRDKVTTYRVMRGDAMLAIAEKFKIKSATILYVNKTLLDDNPHNLRPGMELLIPPVDGVYYEWKEGDTIEEVAKTFDAKPEDIINFRGNQIDLTNPTIKPGTQVMIPGGSRALRDWSKDLVTIARSDTGSTGTSDFGSNACGGGPVDNTFGWPANNHSISGNEYGPGHLAIDIAANERDPIYAAAAGVVTMAQGGYNYGYGNVVEIDHGNGFVTVYAHLSQINVSVCESVGQGSLIGLAGSTGNAFGAHLHFEIRLGGSNVNPHDYVQ